MSAMVGDDPRGAECPYKPCGSRDCQDFGPENCPPKRQASGDAASLALRLALSKVFSVFKMTGPGIESLNAGEIDLLLGSLEAAAFTARAYRLQRRRGEQP